MSQAKHTPGPWFERREGFSTVYIEARIGGGMLQEVAACGPTEAGQDQQAANARLISAAPELLDALRMALDWIDAVPVDLQLPTMPGFDRDYVDSLVGRAQG